MEWDGSSSSAVEAGSLGGKVVRERKVDIVGGF